MRKLLSTAYTDWAFNTAMFIVRVGAGAMLSAHGYDKLVHFAQKRSSFMNFLGIGSSNSLLLVIFAEFFCSLFVIIGLFSRLVVIPPIVATAATLYKVNHSNIFGQGQNAGLFLIAFLAVLLCGPGKASVDGVMGK